jgi:hypothetical protein
MSHESIIRNFNLESFDLESFDLESFNINIEPFSVERALNILQTACTRPPARAPDRLSSTR